MPRGSASITAIRRSFVQINSGQGRRLDHIMVGHALQGEIGSQFTGTLARSTTELGVAFVILVEINGDGTPQENYQRAIKTIDNLEDELVLYLEQDYVVASGGSRSKASEDGFDGLQVGDVAPIPDETGQHLLREVVVSFSLTKYV